MTSSLYFIRHDRFVKIGLSKDPERRRDEIDKCCPEKPALVAVFPYRAGLEAEIHYHFRHLHFRREWFRWHPDIETTIALWQRTGLPAGGHFPSRRDIRIVRERLGMSQRWAGVAS